MAEQKIDESRRAVLQGSSALVLGSLLAGQQAVASASQQDSMMELITIEMTETRNFLASWFAGKVDKPERLEDFYLTKRLDRNFHIVRPDGRRLDRNKTLEGFFGKLYGFNPSVLRHDNDNIHTLLDTDTVAVVGYDESHVYQDHAVVNSLNAVFLRDEMAPNGVSWLLVHETAKEKKHV